jgi:hypothetical protein
MENSKAEYKSNSDKQSPCFAPYWTENASKCLPNTDLTIGCPKLYANIVLSPAQISDTKIKLSP